MKFFLKRKVYHFLCRELWTVMPWGFAKQNKVFTKRKPEETHPPTLNFVLVKKKKKKKKIFVLNRDEPIHPGYILFSWGGCGLF